MVKEEQWGALVIVAKPEQKEMLGYMRDKKNVQISAVPRDIFVLLETGQSQVPAVVCDINLRCVCGSSARSIAVNTVEKKFLDRRAGFWPA